jgi:hypothetical protein
MREDLYQDDLAWLRVVAVTLNWKASSHSNNEACLKRLYLNYEFQRTVMESAERKLLDALKVIPNPNSRAQGFNCLISMRRCAERPVDQLVRGRDLLKDEVSKHQKAAKAGLDLFTKEHLEKEIEEAYKSDTVKCCLLLLFAELGCRVADLGGMVTDDKKKAEEAESNCFVIRARDVLVIRRDYKTMEVYGEKRDVIRGERGKMLRRCLQPLVGGTLIRLKGGSMCPKAQLSARIRDITGTNATLLFKSWVNVCRLAGDLDGIRELAMKRGTDLKTVLSYYA